MKYVFESSHDYIYHGPLFWQAWRDHNVDKMYELAIKTREMNEEEFYHAFRQVKVFHPDYMQAKHEFWKLVKGAF